MGLYSGTAFLVIPERKLHALHTVPSSTITFLAHNQITMALEVSATTEIWMLCMPLESLHRVLCGWL
jgi:hypothetical protein